MIEKPLNISIDINADVGEGVNNESQLMPFLTSCNIACGGHAGNSETMREVLKLAKVHQVKIGAHPSFPDPDNFGRLTLKMSEEALLESLKSQVDDLMKIAASEGGTIHHIKPHGALYNLANTNTKYAEIVVLLMKHFENNFKLYAPYRSLLANIAKHQGIEVVYEAFADRNYNADGTLVSRSHQNAIIEDATQLCNHVLNIVINGKITAITGKEIPVKAETVCIHGDHPQAEQHIKVLTEALLKHNILII